MKATKTVKKPKWKKIKYGARLILHDNNMFKLECRVLNVGSNKYFWSVRAVNSVLLDQSDYSFISLDCGWANKYQSAINKSEKSVYDIVAALAYKILSLKEHQHD